MPESHVFSILFNYASIFSNFIVSNIGNFWKKSYISKYNWLNLSLFLQTVSFLDLFLSLLPSLWGLYINSSRILYCFTKANSTIIPPLHTVKVMQIFIKAMSRTGERIEYIKTVLSTCTYKDKSTVWFSFVEVAKHFVEWQDPQTRSR